MTAGATLSPSICSVLATATKELSAVSRREEIAMVLSGAARRIAGADGLCMLVQGADRYLFAAADSLTPIYLSPDISPLYQLTASACLHAHTTLNCDLAPEAGISLPGAAYVRMRSAMGIPLPHNGGCAGIGFFWKLSCTPSAEELCALEALALAGGIALKTQVQKEELARARAGRRRLHADLQHKVRNILALVRAIVRRTGEAAESPEDFALHLEARISALARVQGALAIVGSPGVELEDLIRTEMTANAVREEKFTLNGPAVRLRARGAETIALAIHELTTNAIKFGALTAPGASLTVEWAVEPYATPPRLKITWSESGVSIAGLAPRRRGFGQELIENTLPYELKARTRFELTPGGVRCEIDLPLTDRTSGLNVPPRHKAEARHARVRAG